MKDPRPQRFEQPACFRVMALMSGGGAGPTHRDRLPVGPSLSRYGVLGSVRSVGMVAYPEVGPNRRWDARRRGRYQDHIGSVPDAVVPNEHSGRQGVRMLPKMVAGLDLRSKHLG